MANSMYNTALAAVAKDLKRFVSLGIHEVDLSGFRPLSAEAAAAFNAKYPNRKPRNLNGRSQWGDSAQVMSLEGGTAVTTGSINVHTIATGDVLGALGFRGTFYITNSLKLVRSKPEEGLKPTKVTLEDVLKAAE